MLNVALVEKNHHPQLQGDNVFTRCVCLCVYVCHDACLDDLNMKDWCRTKNILHVHSCRGLVV